jgi:hypothetical protein
VNHRSGILAGMNSFDSARLAVLRASGWISMGQAGWRVLLSMVMNADYAEYTKNGHLVYCQRTMHLHQQTAISPSCISSTRRKLRDCGIITLMNPEATHSDKVSVWRLNPYPVEPLNREAHPTPHMLDVVAARIIRRRKVARDGLKRRRHAAARQQTEQLAVAPEA